MLCVCVYLGIEQTPRLLCSPKPTSAVPHFLAPGIRFEEDSFSMDEERGDGFAMIQAHCIYCASHLYYYCIVIYNEIIVQLTMMQNQWKPRACLPVTKQSHLEVMGDSRVWAPMRI